MEDIHSASSSAPSKREVEDLQEEIRSLGFLPPGSTLSMEKLRERGSLKEHWDRVRALKLAKLLVPTTGEDNQKPSNLKAALEAWRRKTQTRVFGPYWSHYEEDIRRRNGLENAIESQHPVRLEELKEDINESGLSVMKSWEQLREMRRIGKVERFEKWWRNRPADKRRSWLCTFPEIRQRSDSAIHLFANRAKCPDREREIQEAFLEPILYREDLLQANVLSELLVARSSDDAHPRMLLPVDAQLVEFGYWCQVLPSETVAGRVGFIAPSAPGDISYGIQFKSDALKYPHWSNPITARYQLQVQEKTYGLLVSLLSADFHEHSAAPLIDTEPPSLLTRSMLQLRGRPDRIDWDLVEGILKASLEEALDDLWRLRTDELYWAETFDDMGRNTEKFLTLVFGRIDTFRLACETLRDYNGNLDEARPHHDSGDHDIRSQIGARLDVTLRSIVNEKLTLLEKVGWSPPVNTEAASVYLLQLLRTNKPHIRVLGCDIALRILEATPLFTNLQDNVPAFIRLVLHDISVIVSCMQESRKHAHVLHNEIEELSTYLDQSNDAAVKWDQCDRSWKSLVDTILSTLGNQVHQLNQVVGNPKRPVSHRHTDFWRHVDQRMPTSGPMNHIVRLIISNATPVRNEAISEAIPLKWLSYSTPGVDSTPTATQLRKLSKKPQNRKKKSRRMHSKRSTQVATLAAGPDVLPGSLNAQLPVLILTEPKDQEVWADLSDGQTQVSWKDFNAFLGRLNFQIVPSGGGGAGHVYTRTETDGTCRRIVFHQPHANNIDGVEKSSYWAKRLSSKYMIQVSHDPPMAIAIHN